jgi:hypothetical protein
MGIKVLAMEEKEEEEAAMMVVVMVVMEEMADTVMVGIMEAQVIIMQELMWLLQFRT